MTTLLHVYHSRYDHTATCLPFTLDIHACKTMGLAEFPGRQHVLHGLYPLGMDPLAAPKGWPFAPLYKAHFMVSNTKRFDPITGHCGEHKKSQANRNNKMFIAPD